MAFDQKFLSLAYNGGRFGLRTFTYSTTDALATVEAADYFAQKASEAGARLGDLMTVVVVDDLNTTTAVTASRDYHVSAINATTEFFSVAART